MLTNNINEIELNLLAVMLLKEEKRAYIFENTQKEFFKDITNRQIYQTARELFENDEYFDNVIIYEKIKTKTVNERLIEILTDTLALTPLIKNYCKILFDNYLQELIKNAKSKKDFEQIQELKNKYTFDDVKVKHISEGITDFKAEYERKAQSSVMTAYHDLDKCIGSFMGGDYIALGGSTGTGKTSIALNLARQFCMFDKNVLYFSLEMPIEQLTNRFVCMLQGLSSKKFRNFGFNALELQRYEKGLEELKQWNLNVVCDYNLTIEKMEMYIKQQKKVDFVILDYLGLLNGYNNKSLYEKSTLLSRKIKCLATEFNIPILVLVQLNRNLKERADKRPILSDIRESGAIEQDADFVLFAHRECLYGSAPNNEIDIIIAKNRHGDNNKIVKLRFDLETQNISDLKF